jgi:hypothetical protein
MRVRRDSHRRVDLDLGDHYADAHRTLLRSDNEVVQLGPCGREHGRWSYDTVSQAHRPFLRHKEAA